MSRHRLSATLACLALLLTGCGSPSDGHSSRPALTLESLGSTERRTIDPANRPVVPDGFSDRHIDELAAILAAIARASFSRALLGVDDPDEKVRRVLQPLQEHPEAVAAIFDAAREKFGSRPWQRVLADPFAERSRPTEAAKILKVEWDAARGQYEDGSPRLELRLEVHAAYEVGTPSSRRMIGIRRHLELVSSGPDDWPVMAAGVATYGADPCTSTEKGLFSPTNDKAQVAADRTAFKKSLAADGIVDTLEGDDLTEIDKTVAACKKARAAKSTG